MAKNFYVEVWEGIVVTDVIVRTMLEATSLAVSNLNKQRVVTLFRTEDKHTHSSSAAAQAYIDVELFQLTPSNEGEQA